MSKQISIKNLRSNLANIADEVEGGESFVVIRRSEPSFKIVPVSAELDEGWETVIDFTKGGKEKGVKIQEALQALRELNS